MCYLCDLCAQPHFIYEGSGNLVCDKQITRLRKLPIDYGKQDPREICKHFERKEGGDD